MLTAGIKLLAVDSPKNKVEFENCLIETAKFFNVPLKKVKERFELLPALCEFAEGTSGAIESIKKLNNLKYKMS